MKEIIVVLFIIALLSGIMHTIRYGSILDYLGFFTVAGTYGLGFAGLMTMYQSVKCKTPFKSWLMLLTGATCIFISYLILDTLNILYVKH